MRLCTKIYKYQVWQVGLKTNSYLPRNSRADLYLFISLHIYKLHLSTKTLEAYYVLQFLVVCFLARPLLGRGLQSGVGQQSCGRVCCVERLKVSKIYISKGRNWLKASKITKEINRGQNSFASMPLKILHKCVIGPRYSSDDLNYGQSGNKKNKM